MNDWKNKRKMSDMIDAGCDKMFQHLIPFLANEITPYFEKNGLDDYECKAVIINILQNTCVSLCLDLLKLDEPTTHKAFKDGFSECIDYHVKKRLTNETGSIQ